MEDIISITSKIPNTKIEWKNKCMLFFFLVTMNVPPRLFIISKSLSLFLSQSVIENDRCHYFLFIQSPDVITFYSFKAPLVYYRPLILAWFHILVMYRNYISVRCFCWLTCSIKILFRLEKV